MLLVVLTLITSLASSVQASEFQDKLEILEKTRPLSKVEYLNVAGDKQSLAAFEGELLVINFWATWCPPCIKELPSLSRLQKLVGDKGVRVIAISEDFGGIDKPREFLAQRGLSNLTLLLDDDKGTGFRSLGGRGLPSTLIVNSDNREVARLVGTAEWDDEAVVSFLEKLIGE